MPLCKVFLRYFALFFVPLLDKDQFVMSKWLNYETSESYRYCEASKTIVQNSGVFHFDDFLRQYRDFCLYIIPKGASSVTVKFIDFQFGIQDENGNCTDYLEISSQDVYSSLPSRRYCGYRNPPPFASRSGSVWILVHRETLFQQLRGSIAIEYSSEATCNGDIEMDSYTFVSSPNFHGQTGNCAWTVTLKDRSERVKHQPLQVQLTNWTVSSLAVFGIGEASVTIYDGRGGSILASIDVAHSSPSYVTEMRTTTGPEVYISFSTSLYPHSAFFNAMVKVKGFCVPGTLPCGDGETCYSEKQVCDGELQCSKGYDELGCAPCSPTEFWCGKEDINGCYAISERCNGFKNCLGGMQDEKNCKSCGPGSFLCKADNKCIYERWRCDGDFDCGDNSDEEGCPYGATRRVVTAAAIGALVCSLLLVIAVGCTCKLYSLRASHHRHQQHNYRATPLTRVERELFARQAPPTYDMTVSGVSPENATSTSQRNRGRRSRRYQFQRAAPANVGQQSTSDSRQESVQSSGQTRRANGQTSNPTGGGNTPANAIPTTQRQNSSGDQINPNTDILQQLGTFLFESTNSGSGNPADGSIPAQQRTTSTPPVPGTTKDSGTQTNAANRRGQNTSSSSSANQNTSSSSRRSNRSSSRNRSQRGSSSSSKEQQAKPLPKKKRILPVMVPAPCADVAVEEDMLACVYPCPPSYSQAVASGSPQNCNESTESRADDAEVSSASVENTEEDTQPQPQPETPEPEFSPGDDSLTTVTRSRFLPFSIGQAIRNIASASFSRFRKNPYLQMSTQGSRRNSVQDHTDTATGTGNSFSTPTQQRPSTSSDEDILSCALDNESLRRDSTDDLLPLDTVATVTETPTTSTETRKIFPQRKNLNFFMKTNTSRDDTGSLDMSDFTSFEEG